MELNMDNKKYYRKKKSVSAYGNEIELITSKINKNVSTLRKATGLSQEKFAEAIDCSVAHISKIECNKNTPSIDLLITMSYKFNYPLYSLIPNTEFASGDTSIDELTRKINSCDEKSKPLLLSLLHALTDNYLKNCD